MLKKSILTVLAAAVVVPTMAFAGVGSGKSVKESKELVEECKESWISGDLGVNIVSQYVSRGLVFENQSGIIQPYADIYFKLYEGEGFLNQISLNLGIWNSFHSRRTDNGNASGVSSSTTGGWYEFDFTAGVAFTFAKYFTFTPSYYAFLSPSDAFATFEGINLKLAIDDSEWLGAFSLKPTVQVLFELENKAGSGVDKGVYYELAIAPALPAFGPLTISFPFVVGFGSNNFYAQADGLGFASGGIQAAVALSFIPEKFGTWTATAGATYYYLDASLEDFNSGVDAAGVRRIRNGREYEVVFNGGLMVAF